MLPAFASANTTISYPSSAQNKLLVSTTGGESNYISVTQQGTTYSFIEDGFNDTTFASIDLNETATQCTKITTPTVRVDCTIANLGFIDVNLGTGDFDTFDASDFGSNPSHPVSTNIVVDGGNGDDYVVGGTGNDTLTGGTGDDDLEGDAGNDTIDAGDDDDTFLDGGTGDDTMTGGNGDDSLYGSEGNDRLTGGNGDDSYEGDDGDDTFVAESTADGADTIDDFGDGGIDTADYSARTAAVSLSNDDDFNDGATALSGEDGIGNLDEIGSDVEVLIGGSAADTLTGAGAGDPEIPNVLRGNGGNDTLDGTHALEGPVVSPDTADYSNATSAVTVNLSLAGAQNTGAAGSDTLTSIENAYGGSGADTLTGSGGDNVLRGNGNNDGLSGAGGSDTADYSNATSAVTVNLSLAGAQNTGAAGSDTLTSMENAYGSASADTLTGSGADNLLRGNAGVDTLAGAGGSDTADYSTASGSVTVNLATTTVSGAAGADSISSFENATGGAANDSLTGSIGPNALKGNAGSDTLIGAAGVDSFSGGDDNDSLQTFDGEDDGLIVCGSGTDSVSADPIPQDDPVDPDCETVVRTGPPPAAPTLTATVPNSPANDNSPEVKGSAPADTTVDLYKNGSCTGLPDATGSDANFSGTGLTVSVADDSPTEFSARATNGSQTSGCSTSPLTYIEDSTAPDTAIDSGPSDTTNDTTPTFEFSSEPGSTFQCRVDAGSFAACSSPSTTAQLADGARTFEVRATDAAGNTDATPASQTFTVKQDVPPPGGGGGGGGGPVVTDSNAPKMSLAAKSVKASKKGTVKLQINCPVAEQGGCAGSVSLGKIQTGRATFSRVAGGKKATVTIKLSSKARKTLKKKKKLSATVKITARDDSGNSTTTSSKLTIKK